MAVPAFEKYSMIRWAFVPDPEAKMAIFFVYDKIQNYKSNCYTADPAKKRNLF